MVRRNKDSVSHTLLLGWLCFHWRPSPLALLFTMQIFSFYKCLNYERISRNVFLFISLLNYYYSVSSFLELPYFYLDENENKPTNNTPTKIRIFCIMAILAFLFASALLEIDFFASSRLVFSNKNEHTTAAKTSPQY